MSSSSNLKRLHNQDVNPFMPETDPRNPYGPNYEELPYDTKIYYKFNKVRKYVHFDKEDQEKIINSNYEFVFGVLGAVGFTTLSFFLAKRYVIPKFASLDELIDRYSLLYYGIAFSGSATVTYGYYGDKYVYDICIPFTEKYLQAAIKNGFDDYEISKFKKFVGNLNEYQKS